MKIVNVYGIGRTPARVYGTCALHKRTIHIFTHSFLTLTLNVEYIEIILNMFNHDPVGLILLSNVAKVKRLTYKNLGYGMV